MKELIRHKMALAALLLSTAGAVWADGAAVSVKLSLAKDEVFAGEGVEATVSVTNVGSKELTLPRPDRTRFTESLEFDTPDIKLTGGVGIITASGESPTVTVKPGETVEKKVGVYLQPAEPGSIRFRVGFRAVAGQTPVWSDAATLHIKADKEFTIKVEAILRDEEINIANPKSPGSAKGHIRISNSGVVPQSIGTDRWCGLEELNSLVGDNDLIRVHSAEGACTHNIVPPRDVVLAPGQSYEQDFRVTYEGENPDPGKVGFRVGVKNTGHLPAWSNSLTVRVVEGGQEWTTHVRYSRNLKKSLSMKHPDGLFKTTYEDGTPLEETEYKGGKKNGHSKNYLANGKLSRDEIYSEGSLVSYKTYNADGSIHGHLIFMRLANGVYTSQDTCAEEDSDKEVLSMMPRCKDLDKNGRVVYPYRMGR